MTLLLRIVARPSHDTSQHGQTLTSKVRPELPGGSDAGFGWCTAICGPRWQISSRAGSPPRTWTGSRTALYTSWMRSVSQRFGRTAGFWIVLAAAAACVNPASAQVHPQDGIDRNLQERAAREREFHVGLQDD